MSAGMDFVFAGQTVEYWSWEDALDYAFESVVQTAFKGEEHTSEPRTFREAMQHPEEERQQWLKAAQDEIQSLVENGTFELVECPPGRKAIGSRWVFKVKHNADGSIECYKGRLV
ncbi:hypothetical protein NEOLEDRAFT_1223867, partial [Neolentinus lepideus HHB14362 ss-1]